MKRQVVQELSPYSTELLDPFVLRQSLTKVEMIKVAFMSVIILPIRAILIVLILATAWLVATIGMIGAPPEQAKCLEPLTGWRQRWVKPFIYCMARAMIFVIGYMHVPHKGRRASAKEAPILLVMPHSSFLDTAVVISLGLPGMVVKDSTERTPFIGGCLKYTQPLYVKSEDPNSRRQISEQIRQRVHSGKDWEQLLIFPEGGCGNRKALLQFKLGGFAPGVPVQPVFIRYKNKLDTVTWTWDGPSGLRQILLTLSQFCIHCELEFLPVYNPSTEERENARLFANNVQKYVASWTSTPVSPFTLEDARFLRLVKRQNLPPTAALCKFLRLRHSIRHDTMDPVEELRCLEERARSLQNVIGNADTMARYLGLQRCPEALKDFFRLIDQKEKEALDVRIYAACLCLIREDLSDKEKIKAALQVFECHKLNESKPEQLATILLLWRGVSSKNFKMSI